MKRPLWLFAVLAAAAGCGGGKNVVVRASLDGAGAQPIADLPVRLLPYDRQAILDSIAADDSTPEPRLPADALERLRSLAAEEARVKPNGDSAAARVEAQRRAVLAQLDSIRKAREKWIADYRDDFDDAVKARNPHGYTEKTDTTDARGHAALKAEPAKWWVVARYVLPDEVLEWSVPVTAAKKDSVVVRLTRGNARSEPFF